jgi:hypothetical protein
MLRGLKIRVSMVRFRPNLWIRNILEWVARLHFDAQMRAHYREVAICTGKQATWACFREGLTRLGATTWSI